MHSQRSALLWVKRHNDRGPWSEVGTVTVATQRPGLRHGGSEGKEKAACAKGSGNVPYGPMARLEDLIKDIADQRLREQVAGEVAKLKAKKKFGLVFEEHLP